MSLTKYALAGNNLIAVFPARENLVSDILAGAGKTLIFFYFAMYCVPVFKETLCNKLSLTWARPAGLFKASCSIIEQMHCKDTKPKI
jgi:hypothetical protein